MNPQSTPGRHNGGDQGPVEHYLDEMFDQLAGTGAAGRRALAEAEDHLRSATAAAMTKGTPAAEAEHQAITRFGRPARIAGQLRRVNRASRLVSVLSGGWLLAGLALLAFASTFLAKVVESTVLTRIHPTTESCVFYAVSPSGTKTAIDGVCGPTAADVGDIATIGLAALLAAVAVLAVRRLAVRAGLAPTSRRFPLLVAALFGVVAVPLFFLNPMTTILGRELDIWVFLGAVVPNPGGLHRNVIAGGVALLISVAAVVWHRVRANRPRDLNAASRMLATAD